MKNTRKTKKMNMARSRKKRWFVLFAAFFIVLVLVLAGILLWKGKTGKRYLEESDLIKEQIEVFNDGDMNEINSLIFGEQIDINDFSVPDDMQSFFREDQEIGPVGMIMKRTQIVYKEMDGEKITYEVESPDVRDVFQVIMLDSTSGMTVDEFQDRLEDYIMSAPLVRQDVTVPYENENGEVHVKYNDPAFMNAITGGLMESYMKLLEETYR